MEKPTLGGSPLKVTRYILIGASGIFILILVWILGQKRSEIEDSVDKKSQNKTPLKEITQKEFPTKKEHKSHIKRRKLAEKESRSEIPESMSPQYPIVVRKRLLNLPDFSSEQLNNLVEELGDQIEHLFFAYWLEEKESFRKGYLMRMREIPGVRTHRDGPSRRGGE